MGVGGGGGGVGSGSDPFCVCVKIGEVIVKLIVNCESVLKQTHDTLKTETTFNCDCVKSRVYF